jgi:N-acetylglucosaminyl-diphospho-decaprenol L-rhamnosyltransferase
MDECGMEVDTGVDVVIVHYDTPCHLRCCLESLFGSAFGRLRQVVVVDNASPHRNVEQIAIEFPQVAFLFNRHNRGFAAGCNQGINVTRAPFCLLLNPDAVITGPALETLLAGMAAHSDAGIVAPRMLNRDGGLQMSCRRYPTLIAVLQRAARLERLCPGPVDDYLMRDWDHAQQRQVDWVIGACMLLRRAAVIEVGLLDEDFFMYYEDTDLCQRLGTAGWRVYYEPTAIVRHEHRRESARLLPRRATRAHVSSLVRLFCKHRFAFW